MSTKRTPAEQETIQQQEERLYATCLKTLQAYFDNDMEGGEEVVTAIKTANMLVKREQSQGAREAVHFSMAQAVCKTPEELARYVRATQPLIGKITGQTS